MEFSDNFWKTYEKTSARDFGIFSSIIFNNMELNEKDIANTLLVSEAYIQAMNSGKRKPSKQLVREYFEYLSFDPAFFPKCIKMISEDDESDLKANFFIIMCLIMSDETKKNITKNAAFESVRKKLGL